MGVVTDNLVAEWVAKLATGTGPGTNDPQVTTWADLIGENDVTLYAGSGGFAYTTSSGWAGAGTAGDPYCLVCDGTNDYGTCASSVAPSDADFTIELWIYMAEGPPAANCDFLNNISGATYLGVRFYAAQTSGYSQWALGNGSKYSYFGADTDPCYGDAWQHHVLTYNAATDSAVPYHDGSGGSALSTAFAPYTGTCRFFSTIGNARKLATVRVYSACLSPAEVAANYAAGVLASSLDAAGVPAQFDHYARRRAG